MMFGEMRYAMPTRVRPGYTPQESYWMDKIEAEIAARDRCEKPKNTFLTFLKEIKKNTVLGINRGIIEPHCYLYQDKAIAKIEPTGWINNHGSKAYLFHLHKLYVLDSERSSGVGTAFMQEIKRCANESGAVIFLYAANFNLSNEDEGLPYGFGDMNDLIRYWGMNYLTYTSNDAALRQWYERMDFFNACTHDGQEWIPKSYTEYRNQFVYIGKNFSGDRDSLIQRTDESGMCDFCKKQKGYSLLNEQS